MLITSKEYQYIYNLIYNEFKYLLDFIRRAMDRVI